MKPNQQLKCLNQGSAHTPKCFKAIPQGVCQRLAKLTTVTEKNANKTLKEIYPDHFKALETAKLVTDSIPTLKQEIQKREASLNRKTSAKKTKQKERDRKRATYFCVGYSKVWKTPIHKTIKELKDKHNLKWLRVNMSYHRFTNLREVLQGDLQGKIMHGIESEQFMDEPCNCHGNKTGKCNYDHMCRHRLIIYENTCKNTGKCYIGNTSQHYKARMGNTTVKPDSDY